jgi:hypothetical protein
MMTILCTRKLSNGLGSPRLGQRREFMRRPLTCHEIGSPITRRINLPPTAERRVSVISEGREADDPVKRHQMAAGVWTLVRFLIQQDRLLRDGLNVGPVLHELCVNSHLNKGSCAHSIL